MKQNHKFKLRWYSMLLFQFAKEVINSFSDKNHCFGGWKRRLLAMAASSKINVKLFTLFSTNRCSKTSLIEKRKYALRARHLASLAWVKNGCHHDMR